MSRKFPKKLRLLKERSQLIWSGDAIRKKQRQGLPQENLAEENAPAKLTCWRNGLNWKKLDGHDNPILDTGYWALCCQRPQITEDSGLEITAKMVSELRARTGAGVMDCKKALTEAKGNLEAAIQLLREKGLKASELKSSRSASEGLVVSYIHPGNKVGVLLELNCETDFVARTEEFQRLAKEIAMQVAAAKPRYLNKADVPGSVLEVEKEILRKQTLEEGKPRHIVEKIVEGRISKYYSEVCLLEQPYIREADKTIKQLVQETIAQLGENIVVRRFTLYVLGQGD
jgi:elongation factor Ts